MQRQTYLVTVVVLFTLNYYKLLADVKSHCRVNLSSSLR